MPEWVARVIARDMRITKMVLPKKYAESCEILERSFRAGNTFALLDVIGLAALGEHKLPKWAAEAFLERLLRVTRFECRSLDEAFEFSLPKGKHIFRLHSDRAKASQVVRLVLIARRAGAPVTRQLFDQVGADLGLSGATCSRIYYREKRRAEKLRDAHERGLPFEFDLGPLQSHTDFWADNDNDYLAREILATEFHEP